MNENLMQNNGEANLPASQVSAAEQLSALVDGELARDQVRFLLRNPALESDLGQRWSRYQLIAATLRRQFVAVELPLDFAASIMSQIELADAAVVPARRGYGVLRFVGGGAIAAAVAVAAIVVSRPSDQVRPGAVPTQAIAQRAAPVHRNVTPVASRPEPANPLPLQDFFRSDDVQQASFDSVVPNYYSTQNPYQLQNQYATQSGLWPHGDANRGAAPYVLYPAPTGYVQPQRATTAPTAGP